MLCNLVRFTHGVNTGKGVRAGSGPRHLPPSEPATCPPRPPAPDPTTRESLQHAVGLCCAATAGGQGTQGAGGGVGAGGLHRLLHHQRAALRSEVRGQGGQPPRRAAVAQGHRPPPAPPPPQGSWFQGLGRRHFRVWGGGMESAGPSGARPPSSPGATPRASAPTTAPSSLGHPGTRPPILVPVGYPDSSDCSESRRCIFRMCPIACDSSGAV